MPREPAFTDLPGVARDGPAREGGMQLTPLFDHMRDEHRRLLGRIDAVAARYAEPRALLAPLAADVRQETAALGLELRDHLDLEDEEIYTALARLLPET